MTKLWPNILQSKTLEEPKEYFMPQLPVSWSKESQGMHNREILNEKQVITGVITRIISIIMHYKERKPNISLFQNGGKKSLVQVNGYKFHSRQTNMNVGLKHLLYWKISNFFVVWSKYWGYCLRALYNWQ